MNKPRAFLFDVDNWLGSLTVEEMSGDAVKAYMYLLCRSWHETPTATLPNDDRRLARMAKLTSDDWVRVRDEILPQFQSDGNGRIFNARLKKEADFIAAKSFAGKSGWTTKRRKKQANVGKDNVANLKQYR
ncbi:MAG: DUF1376 domain-containing protein [Acidobacteriota bacterium]